MQRLAAGLHETPGAIVETLDHHAAFVHRAVMRAAQRDEIAEPGLAALGPVMDVMAVDVFLVSAAREDAALVAGFQRATQSRRDSPRLAADVERLTFAIFKDLDDTCVAREAAHRFDRDRRAIIELTAP